MDNTLTVLYQLLKEGLGLSNEKIWVYNQRRDIPTTPGMYVVLSFVSSKVYASNVEFLPSSTGEIEVTSQNVREVFQVDLYSTDPANSAMSNYPRVLGVFNSMASQNRQEQDAFSWQAIPISIQDTSFLPNDAHITSRTTISFYVLRKYEQTRDVEYYDQFNTDILTNE